jgi:hypothetical protein
LNPVRESVHSVLRRLTPWRNSQVTIEETTSLFACGFGSMGWNPLVETLREYERNPTLRWDESSLFHYHRNFCPTSICDLLENGDARALPIFSYPWGPFTVGSDKQDPRTSRKCGPSSDSFIREEFERTTRLHDALRRTGYDPWRLGNTFISGTFLLAADGQRRFVVMQGNHRMASLAVLGVREVICRSYPQHILPAVRERDVEAWPLVRSGQCSRELALRVFRLFFEERGERVRLISKKR